MGYFKSLDLALIEDGVITPSMRREFARQREEERRQRLDQFAADGRLCGHCRQMEAQADGLCALCLDLREQKRQEREQQRVAAAAYRARTEAAGIVVGADVSRKIHGGYSQHGTVIEVGGNYVRVLWRGHKAQACPSWCNGRHHRTYIKDWRRLAVMATAE